MRGVITVEQTYSTIRQCHHDTGHDGRYRSVVDAGIRC